MTIGTESIGTIVAEHALQSEALNSVNVEEDMSPSEIADFVSAVVTTTDKLSDDNLIQARVIAGALKTARELTAHDFDDRLFMHDVVASMSKDRFYRRKHAHKR